MTWILRMLQVSAWHLLLVAGSMMLTTSGEAGEQATLNLNEAVRRTLAHNPKLIAFGHQIDIQKGRLTQSTLGPNPNLDLRVENVFGSGDFNNADSAESTLSLSWVLERGKRQRRIEAANKSVSLVQTDAEIKRLDAAADTARLFLGSLAHQERLTRIQESVTQAKQTVRAVAERVRAGRTPDAELARAEAELARMRLLQEDVEHELTTANYRLAARWGESRPDFGRVNGDIERLPAASSFAELLTRLDDNPDLSRYLTERRLLEAQLRLTESEAKPNWQLNAGIRRLERSNDHAFVAGITIPLTTRNRNQGRIAEAQARMAMTEANRTAARLQIETQLFALHQEFQHSLHRATVLREQVLPRVEQALADTQRAYAAGRYGYLELRQVQTEVLDTRTALVEASIDAHARLIDIERLTGTTLAPMVQP